MSQLYTSSRLKVFRECSRKHFYRYIVGILTPSSPAAEFGTAIHAALEAYFLAWKALRLDERLLEAFAALDSSGLSPFDIAKARCLVASYDARWGAERWEVLGVEVEFRFLLGDFELGGKIDAIVRTIDDDRIWVLEHKSTAQDASPGSTYWQKLAIDTQISIYVDGATMLGHEIAGCIYDVLQRPRHERALATPEHEREYTKGVGCSKCGGSGKPGAVEKGRGFYVVAFGDDEKKIDCEHCSGTGWKNDKDGVPQSPRLYAKHRADDETLEAFAERVMSEIAANPDAFLIRGTVVRLDDELPRMRADLIEAIQLERASALFNLWPRNPDACAKFGSMCSFFDACSSRASIDDQNRFPRGAAHPELAAVA